MKPTRFIPYLLAAASLFAGCQKTPTKIATDKPPLAATINPTDTIIPAEHRVYLFEAEALICQQILVPDSPPPYIPAAKSGPGIPPPWAAGWQSRTHHPNHVPLEDRTTNEIWDRLHIQIFTIKHDPAGDNNNEGESFIIRNHQAFRLGEGYGGWGIMSMCVADLNGDGQSELVFTYSFGSGIHRSLVGVWMGGVSWINATTALADWRHNLAVEKLDNEHIRVVYGQYSNPYFISQGVFGILQLSTGKIPALQIFPDPQLPVDIRARIWYLPQPATSPSPPR